MATATISSKGQITIPSDVRHALHVDTGDRVEFVEVESGSYPCQSSTVQNEHR